VGRKPTLHDNRVHACRLRDAGLRATGPRLAILAELESDTRHPSAEMLLETLVDHYPSMSLSTVYATLEIFLQKGLIRRISGLAGKLRVDGMLVEHDHAICRHCGGVFDIATDKVQRPTAPTELPDGLQVMKLHIEYEVICRSCAGIHRPNALQA
jgi:Fur family peroxide stress response transcriptional regulator